MQLLIWLRDQFVEQLEIIHLLGEDYGGLLLALLLPFYDSSDERLVGHLCGR